MASLTTFASTDTDTIEMLRKRLNELNSSRDVSVTISEQIAKQWTPVEQHKVKEFQDRVSKIKKLIRLEFGIIESVRGFIPDNILDEIRMVFVKVRSTNDLKNTLTVFSKIGDDVKLRQVLKLVNAVYRYNRDLIYGQKDSSHYIVRSKIKHATLCPHCGSTAKLIFENMLQTRAVKLPVDPKKLK